jgi:hypothetical protein
MSFIDVNDYIEKHKKMQKLKLGSGKAKLEFMKSQYG